MEYDYIEVDTRRGLDTGNGKSGGPEDPNSSLYNSELSKKRQKKIYIPKVCLIANVMLVGIVGHTVLDPFAGSLTNCLVAMDLG